MTAAPCADETLRLDENMEVVHVQPEQDSDEHKVLLGIEDFLQWSLVMLEKGCGCSKAFQDIPCHYAAFG